MLTITSLLSILLLTLHVTDDIVHGISKAEPANTALIVSAVFLYGTLVLAERRLGQVIAARRGVRGSHARHSHERRTLRRDRYLQRWLLLRLDTVGARRTRGPHHHALGARTVEPAKGPAPVVRRKRVPRTAGLTVQDRRLAGVVVAIHSEEKAMIWTKNPGRVAGCLYLLLMVAPLRLVYITKTLFVPGDATATARNILAHETLFRFGMFSELFTAVVLIFLTLAFYRPVQGCKPISGHIGDRPWWCDAGVHSLLRRGPGCRCADSGARRGLSVGIRQAAARCAGHVVPESAWPARRGFPDSLGPVAVAVGVAGLPIGVPAALPGRLAGHKRPGLRSDEHHRPSRARIRVRDFRVDFPGAVG